MTKVAKQHFFGPDLGPTCKCYQQMTKVASKERVEIKLPPVKGKNILNFSPDK